MEYLNMCGVYLDISNYAETDVYLCPSLSLSLHCHRSGHRQCKIQAKAGRRHNIYTQHKQETIIARESRNIIHDTALSFNTLIECDDDENTHSAVLCCMFGTTSATVRTGRGKKKSLIKIHN